VRVNIFAGSTGFLTTDKLIVRVNIFAGLTEFLKKQNTKCII